MGSVITTVGARTAGAERNVAKLGSTAKATAAEIKNVGVQADAAGQKTSAIPPPPPAVQAKWQAWGKQIQANEQHIDSVSSKAAVVGAGAAAGIVLATRAYANFDKAMSGVAASAPEAKAQLGALRTEARRAGKETVFSASEAAAGIENLLKAGVSATDVLGGGLGGALDLAAAGELAVADAAELAATAMTQFKLSGKDVPHIADLLAAAAGKAQGEVSDMGFALKQSGLVANQFGLSIETTTGTLAAFASAGLIGSDAGTSFRTMLLSLGNPSKESAKLMQELGISAYDAQGNFVGIENLAQQLQTTLGGLSAKQRDSALATIFGSDAIRAANVLYDEGAAGIKEWTEAVDDAGYAQDVAQTKTDNLIGDLERLGGSWDDLLISMGESANGPGREVVQWLDGLLENIAELPPEMQAGMLLIIASIAGLGLSAAIVGKLVVGISEARTAMLALSAAAPVATRRVAGFAKGATAAGLAVGAFLLGLKLLSDQLYNGPVAKGAEQTEAALNKLAKTGEATDLNRLFDVDADGVFNKTGQIVDGVENISDAVGELTSTDFSDWVNREASKLFAGLPVANPWKELQDAVAGVDAELVELVEGGKFEQASIAFDKMALSGKFSADQLVQAFPAYHAALQEQANDLEDLVPWFDAANLSAQDYAKWMGGEVPDSVQRASTAIEDSEEASRLAATSYDEARTNSVNLATAQNDLTTAQSNLNKEIDKAIDNFTILNQGALDAEQASLAWSDALLGVGKAVEDGGTSLKKNTTEGNNNRSMILGLTTALNEKVAANFKENSEAQKGETAQEALERAYKTAKEEMEKGRQQIIDNTTAAGLNRDEVVDLSDKVLKAPSELKIETDAPGVKTVQQQIDDLEKQIEELKSKQVTIESKFKISGLGELKEITSGADKGLFKGGNKLVGPGYHGGGYTGPGAEHEPAGIVHRDEFVVRKSARQQFEAKHPGALDYLNQTGKLPGFARGGRVTRKVDINGIISGDHNVDIHAPIDNLAAALYQQSRGFMDAFTESAKKAVKEAYATGGALPNIDVNNPSGLTNFRGGTESNLFAANLRRAEQIAGQTIRVFQGGYRPTTSYSGTSHAKDAVDLQVSSALIRALRSVGIAAWDRTGRGNWAPHVHAIPTPGAGYAGGSAVWQAQDYLRGGDGLAGGGLVRGRGGPTADTIPAWLSNGEFVIRTAAAKAIGYDALAAMNALGGYANGGQVAPSAFGRSTRFDVSDIVKLIREINRPTAQMGELTTAIRNAYKANVAAEKARVKERQRLRDTEPDTKARENAQKRYDEALERSREASEKLRDVQTDLAQVQQETANAARQMSDSFREAYQVQTTDARDWITAMRQGAFDLNRFNSQISDLRSRGLSETIIQQIIEMGATAGGELANQLLTGRGKGGIVALNQASQALQDAADRLGYVGATGQGRYAAGGPVRGPAGIDQVDAKLTAGEWVVPAHAVAENRAFLESITYGNGSGMRHYDRGYAQGGPVAGMAKIDTAALAGAVRDGLAGMAFSARLNGDTVELMIDRALGGFVDGFGKAY